MQITLTRKELTQNTDNECRKNWSIEVTAVSDIADLDSKIFVFHAVEDDDPVLGDSFSNVASLQDMNTIPPDAPGVITDEDGSENFIPYYRVSTVTFDCYTADEAERIWRIVRMDTQSLMNEYKASRNLNTQETVVIS